MNYLLDLIVIAIIAAVALISARRGFVRVVIESAGFIAAIFITLTISTPLASLTYDKIIEPPYCFLGKQGDQGTALHRLQTIPGTLCRNL